MSRMSSENPAGFDDLKRVEEIMIPLEDYPWVRITDTISHAVKVIEGAQLRAGPGPSLPRVLLVFDHDDSLAGVVRRRDIMRGLEPKFLVNKPLEYRVKLFDVSVDPHLSELHEDVSLERAVKGLREQGNRPVGDVLRPISTTLKPRDQIMKAVYEMVSLNESLIPVVEEEKILGVVRSVDVFHELAKLLG